jgi:hypothetical protein
MRRKILAILISFCIGTTLFSLELSGTTWGPERKGFGYYLKFKTKLDFEFAYSGEGGGESISGTYTINGNSITLNIVAAIDWEALPDYINKKTIKCYIVDANSVFSQYKIIGEGGLELWSLNHKPKNHEKRILDGIVIYVFDEIGKVNENSRLREGPGLQYKYLTFQFQEDENVYTALPKGYVVTILGYSDATTTIDGVEKPWYYCVFRLSMWEDQFCWIWGGLIDF